MKRTLLFFLLSLLMIVTISAQEQTISIDILPSDPFDRAAKDYPQDDGNGNLYAIIKVKAQSDDISAKDFNYDFGNMKSVPNGMHGDEYWIYMQKGARRIKITRDGFNSYNNDLGMTIEAGETYVMNLSWTQKEEKYQILQFNVQPKDVQATIMYKREGSNEEEKMFGTTNNGSCSKPLPYGRYSYRIMAPLYKDGDGIVTLNNEKQTHIEPKTLKENFAIVTLTVDKEAEIWVNGEMKGTRSWTGPLEFGRNNVVTRMDKHKSASKTIDIPATGGGRSHIS